MSPKKSAQNFVKQRKNIRFRPDASVIAQIDFGGATAEFKPTASALVFSEAYTGCGLVVLTADLSNLESTIRVKIGDLAPLTGEIVWVRELDSEVCKVGVRYLQ